MAWRRFAVGVARRRGVRRVGTALLPVVRAHAPLVAAGFRRTGVRPGEGSRRARSTLARGAGSGARGGGVRVRGDARAGDRGGSRDPSLAGRGGPRGPPRPYRGPVLGLARTRTAG